MQDKDPEAQALFQQMFSQAHMSPGIGLGTPTWDPKIGLERQRQRKMAQGATAKERMDMFKYIGATDYDGMKKVFARAYTSPERAFMLARKG
jgi:hypothetical protein